MEDNVLTVNTTDALRLVVDSEKNSLEEQRVELYGASRDVVSSYKRYSRAKNKVSEKRSARNLARLEKAEAELGMYVDAYGAARKKTSDALTAVIKAHDKYVEALYLSDGTSGVKKVSGRMNSYVKKTEKFIDKVDDSIACISSHYTLCLRAQDADLDASRAQKNEYDTQNSVPNAAFVHTSEIEVSPVSIDIGPTIERAVERAIAELSSTLEQRMSELAATGEQNAQALSAAANRLTATSASLAALIVELDKIIADVGVLTDKCRGIVDMQRSSTRELQGIEVKQRLVNQEQAELIEMQEELLKKQRGLREKLNDNVESNEENGNG